jgi:hypothetical protein
MQVSARAPQAIGDTAEVRVETTTDFVRARPRVVEATEKSGDSLDANSDDETRSALKRLAELIRDKRRAISHDDAPEKHLSLVHAPAVLPISALGGALIEVRVDFNSHLTIPFLLHWQDRKRKKKPSVSDVFIEESRRRKGIAVYKKAIRRNLPVIVDDSHQEMRKAA